MQPFNYNEGVFCQPDIGHYNDSQELQTMADPTMNNVLLGLTGSLVTPPNYVGFSMGDIQTLTNLNNINGDGDISNNHTTHPSEMAFQVEVNHGLDENSQLMMQEMLHQPDQHRQHALTSVSTCPAQLLQTSQMQNCSNFDLTGKNPGIRTSWEESVKYLQGVMIQQQQTKLQNHDQFFLDNLRGLAAPQGFNNFGGFDKGDRDNGFSLGKLSEDQTEVLSLLHLPRTSSSASSTGQVCSAGPAPVQPSNSGFRRSGPVNSCHVPGLYAYPSLDRSSQYQVGIQTPALQYSTPPLSNLLNFNSAPGPTDNTGTFASASLLKAPSTGAMDLEYGHHSEDLYGSQSTSHFMEVPRRSKSGSLSGKLVSDEPKPLHHFATERQRREHLNEKYQMLRSLVPNPTKADRASIVADAINTIQDLKRQEEDLIMMGKDRQMRKNLKLEMRNKRQKVDGSCDVFELDPRGEADELTLKVQWLKRVSRHGTEVDVRIICGEVQVNIRQLHMPKFLLRVMTALETELKLDIQDAGGGVIHGYDVYTFKLKITGNSCSFMSQIMAKIIEILEMVF